MAQTAPLYEYREPGKVPAGILAILVHVLFFAFLVFGFTWRTEQPEGMAVDLWESLPSPPRPVAPPVQVKPVPPRPVEEAPKQEAKPAPAKPDIQLKEKAEKEQLRKEELKKQEEKRRIEQQKTEAIKEAKLREEEAARVQREQEEINRKLLAQQAAEQARVIDEYKARIIAKIRRFIVMPPDVQGNPQAEFEVILLPGGDVLDVKLKKSSNYAAYDAAVERAILLAKPLPLPPDPTLFREFRDLNLKFRPLE